MKYTNESHKAWVVRMLQEIAGTLDMERYGYIEHISAINYAIGYLIGIGWCDDQPTADVVEVVRCKDCKHKPNGYTDDDVLRYPNFPHEENNPCPCQVYEDKWYSWIPNDDFYCSFGER